MQMSLRVAELAESGLSSYISLIDRMIGPGVVGAGNARWNQCGLELTCEGLEIR